MAGEPNTEAEFIDGIDPTNPYALADADHMYSNGLIDGATAQPHWKPRAPLNPNYMRGWDEGRRNRKAKLAKAGKFNA